MALCELPREGKGRGEVCSDAMPLLQSGSGESSGATPLRPLRVLEDGPPWAAVSFAAAPPASSPRSPGGSPGLLGVALRSVSASRRPPSCAGGSDSRRPLPCGVGRAVQRPFGPPLSTDAQDATLLCGVTNRETEEVHIHVERFRDSRSENYSSIS